MSNEELKDLFEDKFKSHTAVMESQFNSMKTVLESINEQVKKTNGRVLKLEDTVISLQLADANHYKSCPQLTKLKEIEDSVSTFKQKMDKDLQEYNFFKQYPKTAIGIIVGIVLITLLGASQFVEFTKTSGKISVPISQTQPIK